MHDSPLGAHGCSGRSKIGWSHSQGTGWVMPYLLYGSRVLPFYMTTRVSGPVRRNCRYLMTILKWRRNVISAVTEVNRAESCQFEHLIEKMMKYYSTFYKLRKAISWLIRIKSHLQKKITGLRGAVLVLELKVAEKMAIKFVQHQAYNAEVEALSQGEDMLQSSSIKSLSPGLQDELLIVGGRLRNSSLGGQAKNSIILLHDHRLSLLIVQEYHGAAHLGVEL